jgi:hypothetical protein
MPDLDFALAREGGTPWPLKLLPVPLNADLGSNKTLDPFAHVIGVIVSGGENGYLRCLD